MQECTVDAETLKQIPLFSTLSQQSIELLNQYVDVESFQAEECIFAEGQRGDTFFILLDGAVDISRHIEGIGEEQLAVHRAGHYFGELAVLDNSPRSATARVLEDTRLLVLKKADLEELMFQDIHFARELLWVFTQHLAVRLRETNEKLRALHQMSL